MTAQTHPPAEEQPRLSWYAIRFERWQEEGERIGLSPTHLEDLSGALGSAAVTFVEHEERPSDASRTRLARAVRDLDAAGGAALEAVHKHAERDPAPSEVLERAMLGGGSGAAHGPGG